MSLGTANPPRPIRRYRRLAWTVAAVLAAAVLGSWLAVKAWRAGQPKPYEPGEENSDEITHTLDRQSRGSAVAAPADAATTGLRVRDQILPDGAPWPRFVDVTARAGLSGFRTFNGARTSQLPEDMGGGAAWGDFDNDGFDDLFLVSAGGSLNLPPAQRAPSQLYRNNGEGTFSLVQDFPETRILGMGAAWADFDNDGWLDLVVTGYDTILLFRNHHGKLVRDAAFPSPKGFWAGVSFGDYDRDGRLDFYVCGYVQYKPQSGVAAATKQFGLEVPFTLNPSSFEPSRNLLFHNQGGGAFREVGALLGVANVDGRSLSALWHDFDGDGWPDLYVANDVSENKLYLNHKGRFVDAGKQAWISEYRGSMGLAAGDWDGDGDDDLFISHWVAQQFALYSSLLVEQSQAATAKSGPAISTELHFMDVAEAAGVGQPTMRSIGWGAEFADFDSDGWLDLAVAAGSTFEDQATPRRLLPMESFLFWNSQGKFLHNLAPWNQSLSTPRVSRGLAVADYDRDGAMDIAIVDLDGGVRLLRNQIPQGNWLELRLRDKRGTAPFGSGEGAQLVVQAAGRLLRRSVGSASYLSQSTRTVHLGLGQAKRADSLHIRWPDGSTQAVAGLDANAVYELTQGATQPRRVSAQPGSTAPASAGPASMEFWNKQRAAMDAMKRDGDIPRAKQLFQEALALNPAHEDSRYYLANCLARQNDVPGAVAQLEQLLRISPNSHRAWLQRGRLLAFQARSKADLQKAEDSIAKALALNPEETGALAWMGELALARGDSALARQRLEWACRTNPKASVALYLRAWIAAKAGDPAQARTLLVAAQAARGRDWKPKGSAMEGDVQVRMHDDATLFSQAWDGWAGTPDPAKAFLTLESRIRTLPAR